MRSEEGANCLHFGCFSWIRDMCVRFWHLCAASRKTCPRRNNGRENSSPIDLERKNLLQSSVKCLKGKSSAQKECLFSKTCNANSVCRALYNTLAETCPRGEHIHLACCIATIDSIVLYSTLARILTRREGASQRFFIQTATPGSDVRPYQKMFRAKRVLLW